VKQRCESNQLIVINDKRKMDARVFKANGRNGEESKTAERVCVRDRAQLEERDSVGNKIDHYKKHL
jgi:hypothetical protein